MVSSVKNGEEQINNDQDRKYDLSIVCQQSEDTIEMASCAVPDVASITHSTITHMVKEKLQSWNSF